MPNHVRNRLRIIAEQETVDAIKDFVKPQSPLYDNAVEPCDKIDFRKILPEPTYKHFSDWFEWRTAQWGTKWNAYDDAYEGDNEIWFNTAWSAPHPVISELAKRYLDVRFEHAWADEDASFNCGVVVYERGMLMDEREPIGNSPEAWELYFELHANERELFDKQADGTYRRIEE